MLTLGWYSTIKKGVTFEQFDDNKFASNAIVTGESRFACALQSPRSTVISLMLQRCQVTSARFYTSFSYPLRPPIRVVCSQVRRADIFTKVSVRRVHQDCQYVLSGRLLPAVCALHQVRRVPSICHFNYGSDAAILTECLAQRPCSCLLLPSTHSL